MSKPLFIKRYLLSVFLSVFAFSSPVLMAMDEDAEDIKLLLEGEKAPEGVVFELIGNEGNYLEDALEKVQSYKEHLHKKFPGLDIAVVSHGSEQFNLTKNKMTKAKEAHKKVQRLVASDIPVHICETHASWRGVTAEDFPDYITVSATGPAQIRQYQELGYELIIIE